MQSPYEHSSRDWEDEAACTGMDIAIFYPEQGESSYTAQRICQACPVQLECLAYAMRINEQFGVWGGYSPNERRALRRKLRLAAAFQGGTHAQRLS